MGRGETEPGWITTAAGVCYPIDSRKEPRTADSGAPIMRASLVLYRRLKVSRDSREMI